jgi:hypothetical protein
MLYPARVVFSNRTYIWSAVLVSIVLVAIFKFIYPYPNMVLDSYYYIMAANSHADVNAWAIGYSWFLRVFGVFSHSFLLFVIFQYLFLEASLLTFFLILAKFFALSKVSKWILFFFFFVNPLFLYCANFVMADALFISLSVLWISLLLWMLYRPKAYLLWVHTILILLVFTVRYNALYYPIVATLTFLVSRYNVRQKILGIGLQVVAIAGFVCFTSMRIGEMTGKAQFSPFGNWKTANDALYMYGHICLEEHDPVPGKFAVLDQTVRQSFYASGGRVDNLLDYRSSFYGSSYMFYNTSPLVRYKNLLYGTDTEFVNFKKMAYVGPLYGEYGAWLIRRYPVAFLRYFVGPNVVRYLFPPMEAFASLPPFHLRPDYLGHAATAWFGVKTLTVGWPLIRLRDNLLGPYQAMTSIIHFLFALNLAGFLIMKGYRLISKWQLHALCILSILWICDLGFNLTAAAIVMRYEVFLQIIEFSLVLWLTEWIYFGRDRTGEIGPEITLYGF